MGHGNQRKLNALNFINTKIQMHKNIFWVYACVHAKEIWAAELSSPTKEFQAVACIRWFDIFKDILEAALSEESMCEWESHNQRDCFVKCSL